MSRRARSAASRMRGARGADLGELHLGHLVLEHRPLGLAAGGDVEDRAVEPPAAVAGLLREPALEHPADRPVAMDHPVLERERPPGGDRLHDAIGDVVVVVGVLETLERPDGVVDEVARRVADDVHDLVAQPLHRPVEVARAAVDRARDGVDERAQHRLARPQPRGAQAGGDAHRQHLGLERHAHHVVGARVERGAQLVGRVEVHAHDDVHVGEVGQRAGGLDQDRALVGVGEHDLRGAGGDERDRLGRLGHAVERQPGAFEDVERVVGERFLAEQQHGVALAHQAVERARRTPLEPFAATLWPPHRSAGPCHDTAQLHLL